MSEEKEIPPPKDLISSSEQSTLQPARREPSEYDLKLDAQVERFLEMKQKLTYFFVTASVAVVAFLVDFMVKNREDIAGDGVGLLLIMLSCVFGLFTAGLSLSTLHAEMQSHRPHLRYRHQRKEWDDLKPEEQINWDSIRDWANTFRIGSFISLFFEIAIAVFFFMRFFGSTN